MGPRPSECTFQALYTPGLASGSLRSAEKSKDCDERIFRSQRISLPRLWPQCLVALQGFRERLFHHFAQTEAFFAHVPSV